MTGPTIETAIWLALQAQVDAAAKALGFEVADGESYQPAVNAAYLRVDHVPNSTLRPFIASDSAHHYRGILQIGVMLKKNTTRTVAQEQAGRVARFFPADLRLSAQGVTIRVTKRPDIGPHQPQATHLMVPVSVDYETYQRPR